MFRIQILFVMQFWLPSLQCERTSALRQDRDRFAASRRNIFKLISGDRYPDEELREAGREGRRAALNVFAFSANVNETTQTLVIMPQGISYLYVKGKGPITMYKTVVRFRNHKRTFFCARAFNIIYFISFYFFTFT